MPVFLLSISCEKEKPEVSDDSPIKFFDESKPETHIYVSSLAMYDENTVIFSAFNYNSKNPLYIVSDGKLIPIDTSDLLKQLPDLKLFYSQQNKKIWYNDHCIISYSPKSNSAKYWRVSGIDLKNSHELVKDKNGAIWETTYGDGLLKYSSDGGTGEQFFQGSLFGEICLDKDLNLITGTLPKYPDEKGVILKYNYSDWDTVYTCSNNSFWVSSMCFDNNDNLWFGVLSRVDISLQSGGGLIKYDGQNFTEYNKNNSGLTSNSITELYADIFGNIWIGTYLGGICKLNYGSEWLNFTFKNDIGLNQSFEHIIIDKDSNIWSSIHFIGLVCFKENK